MTRQSRLSGLAALPMVVLLGAAALPVVFLLSRLAVGEMAVDGASLAATAAFALGGAAVATATGAAAGITAGVLALPAGRWLIGAACVLIAAPPAFWWLGATHVPGIPWNLLSGLAGGAVVAGLALSPVPLLLVLAALRELPSNLYEAARVGLRPWQRVCFVLLPLLRAPLAAGFLLVAILLLGESEIPFLFGFRTAMTDVVTLFAQTYDVTRTIPLVVPLLLAVLVLAVLAGRPLLRTILATSRGTHGVVRRPTSVMSAIPATVPAAIAAISLSGYAAASFAGGLPEWRATPAIFWASIAEAVGCAWIALLLVVVAAYPLRAAPGAKVALWIALLVFCVPAAIFGIGWIGISHALGGFQVPPLAAHVSRAIALPLLGFAIAYARLPRSLEDAARLVAVSPLQRALWLVLPLVAPSLVAASALVAALAFADRDVASLLLPAGGSRLMLDLYLLSANAPSRVVGAAAFTALGGAALSVALAAAGPLFLWRPRG